MEDSLLPIGVTVIKKSKEGGGGFTVVGHVNCERCNYLCEEREKFSPNKKERKQGYYHQNVVWCKNCGLVKYDHKNLTWIR